MLKNLIESAGKALIDSFGTRVREVQEAGFDYVIQVDKEVLLPVLTMLRNDFGFNYLADMVAVDDGDYFTVFYQVYTLPANDKIVVTVQTARSDASLPTATGIWAAADWQEREIFDLMGVAFEGHPNMTRILLPQYFQGHPLRKDYRPGGVADDK